MGAPKASGAIGGRNGMASAAFAIVEQARMMHRAGKAPAEIARLLGQNTNTVIGWVKYRTRING